jgi:hypothetical protein
VRHRPEDRKKKLASAGDLPGRISESRFVVVAAAEAAAGE